MNGEKHAIEPSVRKSLSLSILLLFAALGHAQVVVPTTLGSLEGTSGLGTVSFKGVPYATPLGDLHWKAPSPPKDWSGVRKADAFAPSCIQHKDLPWSREFLIQGSISEVLFVSEFLDARMGSFRFR
jgi:hypothetical protein